MPKKKGIMFNRTATNCATGFILDQPGKETKSEYFTKSECYFTMYMVHNVQNIYYTYLITDLQANEKEQHKKSDDTSNA